MRASASILNSRPTMLGRRHVPSGRPLSPPFCSPLSFHNNNNHHHRTMSSKIQQEEEKGKQQPITNNNHQYVNNDISQKVMNVASSYINNIRLKIASNLTSSMNESDRQQLFSSFNIIAPQQEQQQLKDDAEEETKEPKTLSIGEAVAEALAKEASKRKSIMEQERIDIFQQAEEAAFERVQNDLLIRERKLALLRWEKELEEEKRIDEEQRRDEMVQMEENQQKEEEGEFDNKIPDQQERYEEEHPVLGKVLADFGYKRIHVISTKKLAAIPIWEKQRVYRHGRAKIMAKDKLKSMDIGLPGVIALHEVSFSLF